MTYRPAFVNQFATGPLSSANCTMASAAMALDRHTLGKKTSTGGKMRLCQNDRVGGTDLTDAAIAWWNCYRENLDNPGVTAWTDFVRKVKEGRGAIITGHYGSLSNQYRHQSNFFDNHAMFVNEVNDAGWMLNFDPITHASQWIPASELKRFAGSLSGGNGILGMGKVYAAFTKITNPQDAPHTPIPPTLPSSDEVDSMIAEGGLTITSSHIMNLKKGTPLYKSTKGDKVAAKMSKDSRVPYFGIAGSGWRCVQVKTGSPYKDKVARPTLLYVHASAGDVELR